MEKLKLKIDGKAAIDAGAKDEAGLPIENGEI